MGSGSEDPAISSALREQLLQLSTPASKSKGTILFRRGEVCVGVFLICKGKVRLALDAPSWAFPPRILGPGCVAGLPAALADSPYSLSAEVVEDAELACISQRALCECLRQNAKLCFEVMDILSHEISSTRSAMKQKAPRSIGWR